MIENLGRKKVPLYSPYLDLLVGVPQGSILGPLLFNICMCDLFLCDCESNINYADDTTLYACEPDMDLVLSKLKKTPLQFLHSFKTTIWKLMVENHIS